MNQRIRRNWPEVVLSVGESASELLIEYRSGFGGTCRSTATVKNLADVDSKKGHRICDSIAGGARHPPGGSSRFRPFGLSCLSHFIFGDFTARQ